MNIVLLSSSYIRYRLDKSINDLFETAGCYVTKFYASAYHIACDDETITYLTLVYPGLIMSIFTLEEYKRFIGRESNYSELNKWLSTL